MEEKNTNDMDETRRKIEALKEKYGTKSPSSPANENMENPSVKKEVETAAVVNPKKKEGLKAAEPATQATKKQSEIPKKMEKEKKSSKGKFLFLLLVIVVIGGGVYYFFFYNQDARNSNTEQMESNTFESEEDDAYNNASALDEDNSSTNDRNMYDDANFENRGKGEVSRGNFTSKFFISIVALKSEDSAKEEVKRYQRLGYDNPSYFFIPDHFENGAKMFKVVLGPYNSKAEAEADLPAIKVIRKDAYIDKAP